jgi:hypothetical protein
MSGWVLDLLAIVVIGGLISLIYIAVMSTLPGEL